MTAKKKLTPIECSNCGKRIKKGQPIYSVEGIIYKCCSSYCLAYAMTNMKVTISTGYYETERDYEE